MSRLGKLPAARALGGLPIFWQTLLLLFASLIVSQAVSIALLLSLPPQRPDFNRLGDIAEALDPTLRDRGRREGPERGARERALIITHSPAAPAPSHGMVSETRFAAMLADTLGVPIAHVRFYFEADQRGPWFDRPRRSERLVPMRRGEPIFFNTVLAGLDTGDGWRVVRTKPRPPIGIWERRVLLWFGISALVLLPFAWLFARRLTRPISRFAASADRMSGDPLAPRVLEEGPAELRTTAHALNRMQDRLSDYLAERTAMIGAIAHDLRTPLARIAFRIEAAPDEVRDKVQADIEQMRAMIAATIGFVKGTGEPLQRAPIDLDAMLRTVVAEEQDMGRAVALGDTVKARIMGDRVALGRLLQNLIDNGVTYGSPVTLALRREGDRAIVTVADRGPGLKPELLDRVFQPFERGDPSRNRETGGIGLGLTIARAIARDHGGTLMLRNGDGGGLEAIAAFPVAAHG